MKFQFEGNDYVIGFAHDPSRDWGAHVGHDVMIGRPTREGILALFCESCELQISHVPKAARPRLTVCRIERIEPSAASGKIFVAHGVGRCNEKDRWTREGGRLAALRNAFAAGPCTDWTDARRSAFRAAAWEAYQLRHWETQVRQLADADRALALARERSIHEGGIL